MADYGELGYLLNQRGGNRMQNAGSEIGLALAGGDPLRRAQIESQGAMNGARMADVLAQARQRQQQEIGRQNLAEEFRKRGDTIGASTVAASSSINPGEMGQYLKHVQEVEAERRNLELADEKTVDYNHLNARKIAMAPGPTELVRALGEGAYTTNAYRTDPTVVTNEMGKALIGERNAATTKNYAEAARAKAGIGVDKAANYDIVDTPQGKVRINKLSNEATPVTMDGQPVAGVPKTPHSFTEHEMAAAMSTPASGGKIDPARFNAFEDMKAKSPGAGDSDVLAKMRQTYDDDPSAVAQAGPPSDLAPSQDGFIAKLFGGGAQAAKPANGKTVVKQLIKNGRKVNVYADGSGDYAD